jgi:hypothetical protein
VRAYAAEREQDAHARTGRAVSLLLAGLTG